MIMMKRSGCKGKGKGKGKSKSKYLWEDLGH